MRPFSKENFKFHRGNNDNPKFKTEGQFKNTLLKGNITKNIIVLAIPIITANIIANAYYVVDMIFVGRLGPSALAAVSMGGILMSLTWTLQVGLTIGASSLTARFYGARDNDMVERIVINSLFLAFIIAFFLFIFGIFGTPACLRLLGSSGEVLSLAITYTRIVFCGAGGLIFLFVINSMLRGSGDVKTPMITLGISSILNIILDPLLIFGLGPFPELGVKGAAIATVTGQAIGALCNFIILFKGYSRIKVSSRFAAKNFSGLKHSTRALMASVKPDLRIFKTIIKISIPGSMQNLIYSISGLVLMRMVTIFGTPAVAAYGIGLRLDIMIMLPGWALGAAVATILGQNLGAQQPERAEKTAWHGAGLYLGLLLILCSGLWAGAPQVISLFNNDPVVMSIGKDYIRIVSVGYLFLSFSLILNMAMNGAGYTFIPMILIAAAHLGLRIPAAFVLMKFMRMGTQGIWVAIAGSIILQAFLAAAWFYRGNWKRKKVA
ncbi:hypothetical protein AMJ80_06605 [bacterium SM23_31]|nr:MAG: hypothetical protein AMJ80_06605 [bacterium SM23_31]